MREESRAKSGIDGNICGEAIQMALKRFQRSQRVDDRRSILNYFNTAEGINNLTLKEGDTYYYGKRECSS